MKNLKKYLFSSVQVVILAVFISVAGSVYAATVWNEPTCSPSYPSNPPTCNADAPINVSSTGQIKSGGLTVGADSSLANGNGLLVLFGKVGIGTQSPGFKLDVVGSAQIYDPATQFTNLSFGNGNAIYTNNATPDNFIIRTKGGVYIQKADDGAGNCNGGCPGAAVLAGAFYYLSDRSFKTNIAPLQDSLSKILQLQGVSFNWKADGKPSVGLIAQDVEKVYPELVSTEPKTGIKSLEYGNLIAPLIEAVKTQQKEIDDLKVQVKELQNKKY